METARLIIDAIRPTDREDYFFNISHDKKVLETFICRYAESLEDFDFSSYPGRDDLFAIRLRESGRLIGIILYFDEKDGACEIGYGLGSEYWGRGYATEAVGCFLDYLFREKGMRCVYASFFAGNEPSRRVMEKCGMRYSRFSEKELSYLGVERDLVYYEIDSSRAMDSHPGDDPTPCCAEDKPLDIRKEAGLREEQNMNDFIAYCGLDCESCEARLATVNDDEALREKVAALWSKLNGVEITPESIRCAGCRRSGVKTPFCESLCPIRQCALGKGVETCGGCAGMESCEKLGMITRSNSDALKRLREG